MEYIYKINKSTRSLRLRLDDNGQVIVTAPPHLSKIFVNQFVNTHQSWIIKQQQQIKLKMTLYPTLDINQNLLSYLGQLYRINFNPNLNKRVCLKNHICHISPITQQKTDIKPTLLTWLKNQAESDILHRLIKWASIIHANYGLVRFKQQSSRWGSCSSNNDLNFNWRLIHFSPLVIDYVVIHELTHTIYHNHSDQFWQLVKNYCPNYTIWRRFLKKQHLYIEKI